MRVIVEPPELVGREPLLTGRQLADVDQRAQGLCSRSQRLKETDDAPRMRAHLGDDLQHVLEPVGGGDRAVDGDQRAQLVDGRAVPLVVDQLRLHVRSIGISPAGIRPLSGPFHPQTGRHAASRAGVHC